MNWFKFILKYQKSLQMSAQTPETLILDYGSFISHYNTQLRYPNCVIEHFNGFPSQEIQRESFRDKFRPDPNLDPELQLTVQNYHDYIIHGGSFGHNAPAAFHKTSEEQYLKTFWLTNLCPQEGTFNAGLWQLIESWTCRLIKKFATVTVVTGSIKGQDVTFGGNTFNLPSHMFKIVLIFVDGVCYTQAYLAPNRRLGDGSTEIETYSCSVSQICEALETYNGFDLKPILEAEIRGLDIKTIDCLPGIAEIRGVAGAGLVMTKSLRWIIKESKLYEAIIYARSLEELDKVTSGGRVKTSLRRYYVTAKARLESVEEIL